MPINDGVLLLEIQGDVEFNEVLQTWAKRENKTLANLKEGRAPLLNSLPADTRWFKVMMSKNDLKELQVINENACWGILSSDGNMQAVADNLEIFTENPPNLPHLVIDGATLTWQTYFDHLVNSLNKFRKKSNEPNHNLTLILIASSMCGPYTVLEGNHTAVSLYFKYFKDQPEIEFQPFISYLGVSQSMPSCEWYHA